MPRAMDPVAQHVARYPLRATCHGRWCMVRGMLPSECHGTMITLHAALCCRRCVWRSAYRGLWGCSLYDAFRRARARLPDGAMTGAR